MTRPLRSSPLAHWSGWIPVAIPVMFIALAIRRLAIYGPVVEVDEGVEAHLFQLLMPVDLLVMAYFAFSWVPRSPRPALLVLGLQVAATGLIFGLVYWSEHASR